MLKIVRQSATAYYCTYEELGGVELAQLPEAVTVDILPQDKLAIRQLEHGEVLSHRIYGSVRSTMHVGQVQMGK